MITRDNYQEFFLLYVDNELSAADARAVEEWVAANPDLREEWDSLQTCRVVPDEKVIFPGKDGLLRGGGMAEYLLSYVDGELSPAERKEAEALIASRPGDAAELERLLLTVSKPDMSVVFPGKSSLYRKEKGRRVIMVFRAAAVAAAVILIAVPLLIKKAGHAVTSGAGVALQDKKHAAGAEPRESRTSGEPQDARERQDAREPQQTGEPQDGMNPHQLAKAQDVLAGKPGDQHPSPGSRQVAEEPDMAKVRMPGSAKARGQRSAKEVAAATRTTAARQDPVGIAIATPPATDRRSAVTTDAVVARLVQDPSATRRITDPITEINSAVPSVAVRQADIRQNDIPKDQSSFATQALLQGDDEKALALAGQPAAAGKSKLRGLFRKVARTFGSTAERDGEGKREVLISAFQVAVN